ncbi:arsenate reductase ArsC [Kaarinaea lacus]
MSKKQNILFLCTGNSCRSQMAEGWGKFLLSSRFNVYSAGIEKHGLNPNAVKVMKENGVDISSHYSKTLDDLKDVHFDVVVTVCGHADETCPVFPGNTRKIHYGFDDPPKLAANAKTEEEKLMPYRRVCGEIKNFIKHIDDYIGHPDQKK